MPLESDLLSFSGSLCGVGSFLGSLHFQGFGSLLLETVYSPLGVD